MTIPIIGEPFKIEGMALHVIIRCKCKPPGQEEILLVIGQPGSLRIQCPACRRVFVMANMRLSPQGQLEMYWASGIPGEVTPPPTPVEPASADPAAAS